MKELDHSCLTFSYGSTFQKIIEDIKKNFENILSINRKADIYVLGKYTKTKENLFLTEIKKTYNEKLQELCKMYNLIYIDLNRLTKLNDFELVNLLIDYMYEKPKQLRDYIDSTLFITNEGSRGIIDAINYDYKQQLSNSTELSDYEKAFKLEEYKKKKKYYKKYYKNPLQLEEYNIY